MRASGGWGCVCAIPETLGLSKGAEVWSGRNPPQGGGLVVVRLPRASRFSYRSFPELGALECVASALVRSVFTGTKQVPMSGTGQSLGGTRPILQGPLES